MRLSSLNRKILALAIPSIAANVTTPLLGLVDTAIVGHMGSAVFIAAIAVGSVMFNMVYWFFSFLRAGTSGLAGQACGAADTRAQGLILSRSLVVALGASLALILLQRPLEWALLWLADPDPHAAALASRYFRILIYGAPAMLATYALSGWFLGMQNSKVLMWTSLVVNITNIAASLTLVYGFRLGIEGVACGTLIAQWSGLAASLLFLRRYRLGRSSWSEIARWDELKRFFKVNFDVMLRTVCLMAVTMWFTRSGASQGSVVLAVNTLLMQLFLLFSYVMDGFAFAAEALAGRFTGAGDRASLRATVKATMGWDFALALIFTALYFAGGEWFMGVLATDPAVLAAGRDYALWAVSVPLCGFGAFVWDGVYIGATLTRRLLLSMAGATLVFFILQALLTPSLGNHALWLAFASYLLARTLLQTILYPRGA
ncbi:MAG: MATE family efflux transporter [[Clostridium] fimetarium]|nr:MATE family efflux transporter [[Clostridium] fimetarium]